MAEAVFPIFEWMEISAAIRADDYSDFGSASSPRLGVAIAVPGYEQLRFRASGVKASEPRTCLTFTEQPPSQHLEEQTSGPVSKVVRTLSFTSVRYIHWIEPEPRRRRV